MSAIPSFRPAAGATLAPPSPAAVVPATARASSVAGRPHGSRPHRPGWLLWPAIVYLAVTTQVPFLLTVFYSLYNWRLTAPESRPWLNFGSLSLANFGRLFTDGVALEALGNSIVLMAGTCLITVVAGWGLALLLNRPFFGRPVLRTLLISPFFVMPVVTAVVWKTMLMNPVYGLFSFLSGLVGAGGIDWLSEHPRLSIIVMASWEWTPFAMLILLTSLQSLPLDELEAARLDGAGWFQEFRYVVFPHCARALEVIVLLETIFLLQVFAEIYVSTSGGPGTATTNLPYFIWQRGLIDNDVSFASAASVVATVITNVVAIFMIRLLSRPPQTSAAGGAAVAPAPAG